MESLLQDDLFFTLATRVFSTEHDNFTFVSRFSTILYHILALFPAQAAESCAFIVRLLHYIEDDGVCHTLIGICNETSPLTESQRRLVESDFAGYVLKELKAESTDKPYKIINMMKLIHASSHNKVLSTSFCSSEIVSGLYAFIDTTDLNILNQLWKTLESVLCIANMSEMSVYVNPAISLISGNFTVAHICHVYALDFLAQMLKYHSPQLSHFMDVQLIQVIIRIIVQFQSSSNFMGSVFRFLKAGLTWSQFTRTIVYEIVPALVIIANQKIRNAAAANSVVFLAELQKKRADNEIVHKTLSELEIFHDFCCKYLKWYNALMENGYGGTTEKAVVRSTSSFVFM